MKQEGQERGGTLLPPPRHPTHPRGPGLSPWEGKRLLPRALKQPEVSPVQLPLLFPLSSASVDCLRSRDPDVFRTRPKAGPRALILSLGPSPGSRWLPSMAQKLRGLTSSLGR